MCHNICWCVYLHFPLRSAHTFIQPKCSMKSLPFTFIRYWPAFYAILSQVRTGKFSAASNLMHSWRPHSHPILTMLILHKILWFVANFLLLSFIELAQIIYGARFTLSPCTASRCTFAWCLFGHIIYARC